MKKNSGAAVQTLEKNLIQMFSRNKRKHSDLSSVVVDLKSREFQFEGVNGHRRVFEREREAPGQLCLGANEKSSERVKKRWSGERVNDRNDYGQNKKIIELNAH